MWQRFIIDDNNEAYGAHPFCCRDCAINYAPETGERLSVATETNGTEFPDGVQCVGCGKELK